jgi:VCBS repeat-containing protein
MKLDQVIVIIDDFSYRSLDSDNVYYYDLGAYYDVRWFDYNKSSYFESGEEDIANPYEPIAYHLINPDDFTTTIQSNQTSEYLNNNGFEDGIYYEDWIEYFGDSASSDNVVLHGDWVYKSFIDQLDDKNTDVILIDVDNWSNTTLDSHLDELFGLVYNSHQDKYTTQLESIVDTWIVENNTNEKSYSFSVLSFSIGGTIPSYNETLALDWMEDNYVMIVQSTSNVNQGGYNWGSTYSNVINIGAWNVDSNNNSLHGELSSSYTIDIFADGYIIDPDWGWNFGTSFATPKVAAELANEFEVIITDINSQLATGELTEEELLATDPLDYADIVDIMKYRITSEVVPDFNSSMTIIPVNVLSDDIVNLLYPVTVPELDIGIEGMKVENVYLITDFVNNEDGTQSRTYIDQNDVIWSAEYSYIENANDVTYHEVLTSSTNSVITKHVDWKGDDSSVATKASSYSNSDNNTINRLWRWDAPDSAETITRENAQTGQKSVDRYSWNVSSNRSYDYADTLINEDSVFNYDASIRLASDNLGTGLTYSATLEDGSALPDWLTLDRTTGIFSGTPTNGDTGLVFISTKVVDSEDVIQTSGVHLTVNNVNDAPTLTGDFVGLIVDSTTNVTGILSGTDVDQYQSINDVTNWTIYDESTGNLGESVYTRTNSNGDERIYTYLENEDGSILKTWDYTLADGDWAKQVRNYDVNGDYVSHYTDSVGANYTAAIVISDDGSTTTTYAGDATSFYGDLYFDLTGTYTKDSDGNATSYFGQVTTEDSRLLTRIMDGVKEDGSAIKVNSTSTNLGIDFVHREGLSYTIENQQGTYGTLQLNEQTNWTYTFDESSIVNNGQMATDSFNLLVSDGEAEISQLIDVFIDYTPVDAIILTGTNQYLHNIALDHTDAPFTIDNGELRVIKDTTIDTVILTEEAYSFDAGIDISDAIDVLRHIVDLEVFTSSSFGFHAADVDNNGSVNISDAIDILRHIVDLEPIDSFDLIDTNGARVTSLDANASGEAPTWTIVANGDADMSGEFAESYVTTGDFI